ncbi:hypothetical protein ACLOJK_013628 [Asimina triloba]
MRDVDHIRYTAGARSTSMVLHRHLPQSSHPRPAAPDPAAGDGSKRIAADQQQHPSTTASLPADDPPPPCSIFPNGDRRRRPTHHLQRPLSSSAASSRQQPVPFGQLHTLSRSHHHKPIDPAPAALHAPSSPLTASDVSSSPIGSLHRPIPSATAPYASSVRRPPILVFHRPIHLSQQRRPTIRSHRPPDASASPSNTDAAAAHRPADESTTPPPANPSPSHATPPGDHSSSPASSFPIRSTCQHKSIFPKSKSRQHASPPSAIQRISPTSK